MSQKCVHTTWRFEERIDSRENRFEGRGFNVQGGGGHNLLNYAPVKNIFFHLHQKPRTKLPRVALKWFENFETKITRNLKHVGGTKHEGVPPSCFHV